MICFDGRVLATLSASGRRLLAALLLAGCAVVLGQLPAHACSCVTGHTQAQTERADDVFTGTVTKVRTQKDASGRGATMTYDVAVDRVYKGDVRTEQVQVTSDRSASSCGLGQLPADKRYLWFTRASGQELTSDTCAGTAPVSGQVVHKVEKILGDGHPPVPPPPPKAVFTRVADAQPTGLPRLAAPGVALVIAGLLGLVVVRRLGRRA